MNAHSHDAEAPVQVALVAAYPAVRAGLRALLAGEEQIEVTAEAATLADLVVEGLPPLDAVVIDLDLEGSGGITEDVPALPRDAGVVLLGPAAGDTQLLEILGERPWAYLLKDAGSIELSRAIAAVAAGLVVLQPPLPARLLHPSADDDLVAVNDNDALTPREHEVLQLVAEGLPNKTIARRLGISEHTVKFHLTSILTKLDASSRTDAVRLGARRGLIVL